MLATLDEMQALTEAGLLLARGTAAEEPTAAVDLGALVESLVADQADLGADVTVEPPAGRRIVLRCRPLALKRALRNLVEGAVRWRRCALALAGDGRRITLTIDDDGPGLPGDLLERVFDPFVRGEASRSPETGGAGLGPCPSTTILRAPQRDVALANRDGGGLQATVTLPVGGGDI
ncbi:MAG: ATP-binding protein [Geminicoccaceae bacterium]